MFWTKPALTEQNIVSLVDHLGIIESIHMDKAHVLVTIAIDPSAAKQIEPQRVLAEQELKKLRHVKQAQIILTAQATPAPTPVTRGLAPDVRHIIAVASGKGGVGKSTVAANLAVALAQQGLRVGLLDADIYGPSVPTLMGVRGQKPVQNGDMLEPIVAHGVAIMSMGSLLAEDVPMIWRGPMIQKAIVQMLRDVRWGALDVLLLDMPPGTGDAQLTIAQKVKLTGAIIVSTPQDLALLDATKAIDMFYKVNVPILGLIENMSFYCCPQCGFEADVFGHGTVREKAQKLNVAFLGALPLDVDVRIDSDSGQPVTLKQDHVIAKIFGDIASYVRTKHLDQRVESNP